MKYAAWKHQSAWTATAVLCGALAGCNSHLLLESNDDGGIVIIKPPPVTQPPDFGDASLPPNPFGEPSPLGGPDAGPDAVVQPGPDVPPGTEVQATPDVAKIPDASPDTGPEVQVETPRCPSGTIRVHVRDVWSNAVDPPSLKTLTSPPSSIEVIDGSTWATYGARQDSANCTYYSVCLATTVTKILFKAIGPDSCPAGNQSGNFDISSFKNATDI